MTPKIDGSAVGWGPAGVPGLPTLDATNLVLWGIGTSRTFRAHWMLAEMALPYVSRRIQSRTGETMKADYLRLNPRHKIPLLQHGKLLITESAAIIQYLADQFAPSVALFVPTTPASRAKLNEWCFFIMSELDAHTLYVIRRHDGLKHLYGEAPAAVAAAKTYFSDQLGALHEQFEATDGYLFGDRLSVADILLTSCLDWAVAYDIPLPAPMRAYRQRVIDRPAYREARRRNDPAIQPTACAGAVPMATQPERS